MIKEPSEQDLIDIKKAFRPFWMNYYKTRFLRNETIKNIEYNSSTKALFKVYIQVNSTKRVIAEDKRNGKYNIAYIAHVYAYYYDGKATAVITDSKDNFIYSVKFNSSKDVFIYSNNKEEDEEYENKRNAYKISRLS